MDEHPLVEQFRRECSTAPLGLWATGEIPPWEIEIRPDGTGTVHYGGMEKDEWEIEWRTVAEREIEIRAVSYQNSYGDSMEPDDAEWSRIRYDFFVPAGAPVAFLFEVGWGPSMGTIDHGFWHVLGALQCVRRPIRITSDPRTCLGHIALCR